MAVEQKLHRCPPGSPLRCQATHHSLQCPYEVVFNEYTNTQEKYCPRHMAATVYHQEKEESGKYRLLKWMSRVGDFANSSNVKSLREEIGVTKMVLEELLARCEGPDELLMFQPRIMETVSKIERLVNTCHNIDKSLGEVVDKSTLLSIAERIVKVIIENVLDPGIVDNIAIGIQGIFKEHISDNRE